MIKFQQLNQLILKKPVNKIPTIQTTQPTDTEKPVDKIPTNQPTDTEKPVDKIQTTQPTDTEKLTDKIQTTQPTKTSDPVIQKIHPIQSPSAIPPIETIKLDPSTKLESSIEPIQIQIKSSPRPSQTKINIPTEDLATAHGFCSACFSGHYPLDIEDISYTCGLDL